MVPIVVNRPRGDQHGYVTPVDPLLDWSYEAEQGALPIAYRKPARQLAGPWPLIIPYNTPSRPWVAEITGPHETYRYARIFLKDERTASGRRFMLQPGVTYEVSSGNGDPRHPVAADVQQDSAHRLANGKRYEIGKGLFVDGKWTWPGVEEGCKCSSRAVIFK
jgi:hypothetical protein